MADHIASLSAAVQSVFNDKASADFRIICKDQTFYVHTLILNTRSAYFRGLTSAPFKESKDRFAEIDDVEPKILKAVLEGVYGEDYEAADGTDLKAFLEYELAVMTLAKRFLIYGLEGICAEHIDGIDTSAFRLEEKKQHLNLLVQIWQHFNDKLASECMATKFKSYVGYIAKEAGYHMLKECPGLLAAIVQDMAPDPANFVHFECSNSKCYHKADFRVTLRNKDIKEVDCSWKWRNRDLVCPACALSIDLDRAIKDKGPKLGY